MYSHSAIQQDGNDATLEPDIPTTSRCRTFSLPLLPRDSKHLWTPRLPLLTSLTNRGVRTPFAGAHTLPLSSYGVKSVAPSK